MVSGKRKPPARLLVDRGTPLDEVASLWLADIKCDDGPYLIYVRHWQRYFEVCGNLTRAKIAEYWQHRLGVVLRRTLVKERGPLQDFLDWCATRKVLSGSGCGERTRRPADRRRGDGEGEVVSNSEAIEALPTA